MSISKINNITFSGPRMPAKPKRKLPTPPTPPQSRTRTDKFVPLFLNIDEEASTKKSITAQQLRNSNDDFTFPFPLQQLLLRASRAIDKLTSQ